VWGGDRPIQTLAIAIDQHFPSDSQLFFVAGVIASSMTRLIVSTKSMEEFPISHLIKRGGIVSDLLVLHQENKKKAVKDPQ
jgi:hypothetical protein